ncbi:NAD-glutamate dehydrogenase [Arsenicicoccus sp. oral taxon 190]|uniref:NAD-glutamate dehydrogenase n=1 Tax=Arsenicicoccus sp. oral taxon 190 TaxID=1658671 RepID=UPI000679FFB9|nr:NAD-glutamate dehydrogenase [Arsenicicoccus sp. oral taxon 190]AKT51442.1 NAD-glutamate dehydrogenase [Arsenicicoccus sp. oral taxon 190]
MSASFDQSRDELLTAAAQVAGRSRDGTTAQLLSRYYWHTASEDLAARAPEDLLGAALSHRDLARQRDQGTANVRVFTPTVAENKWSCGHTVVQVVTDDMPFLVDSVNAAIMLDGRTIHHIVHPRLVVRRDLEGRLVEVLDVDPEDAPAGEFDVVVESWMHVEIDRESDPQDLRDLEARVRRVLGDVREAVEDWPKMRDRAAATAAHLQDHRPPHVPDEEVDQAVRLLEWLADDNFTFVGCRDYQLEGGDDELALRAVQGTGLGILRYDERQASVPHLEGEVRAKAREPHVLIITKANSRSTVHRSAYLDYIGVKTFDDEGVVVGERRFLGLFTSGAYTDSVLRIPVVADKVQEALRLSGYSPDSHDGRDLVGVLQTFPRDEIFQSEPAELAETAMAIIHAKVRRQLRVFLRQDVYGRFTSCLVYLPRDRYNTYSRLRIEALLREAFASDEIEYTTRVNESTLARLHFVVRTPRGVALPDVDRQALEKKMIDITRAWGDDLGEAVTNEHGEEEAARLLKTYGEGFSQAYKEDFTARVAVVDLEHLEALGDGRLGLNLYQPLGAPAEERRMKVYTDRELSLSRVLPIFTNLGVEVTDERPYAVERDGRGPAFVYDFGLKAPSAQAWDDHGGDVRGHVQEVFAQAWSGEIESDRLNALVLGAGLTARQVVILRSIAKYLRQAGTTFTASYIQDVLVTNPRIARMLVELFETRFGLDRFSDEAGLGERHTAEQEVVDQILEALEDVASLDADRIIRAFLGTIQAVLRTNYYQRAEDGSWKPYLAMKLDPHAVPGLPAPRPRFEVWVYGPRVEGVHLRFGNVARGGLRWSDRREDFRTEVLGLVKAQMVKNAVIVPTGSKGGFFAKQLPDPAVDRDAWLAEGVEAYKLFISGLLDLTDNRVGQDIVPPRDVVRHDPDDPYLVVAADKGTAKFSDIANGVAQSYGFWLDDAFASGGSAGYDHKGMGITARGAWESVKRHFRELGLDTQTEDFTVVGVGDMSGDVFGNGMLLSEHIRLVAAFDHRHIFVDPSPVADSSYAERRRLFDLPRSSWADYDEALISEGGGVFPRSAKSVPVSPQMAEALGIENAPATMTPAELMKAILQAPVDLVWNGGIGTYIKASPETNASVGDRANDPIRVDGRDLRCRVVGEGGNLGATQLGRIEAARAGIHVNTDAIDNSAGVDTSDHEVNIKILLTGLMKEGDLTLKQRNELLASMTDEVAYQVLRDNYEQNVLLGNARHQEHLMLPAHKRLIGWLEERGELDRSLEFLPSDAEIDQRNADGAGLTSPEASVLVAYSKLALKADLQDSGLPDEPFFRSTLAEYFPEPVRERYAEELQAHPLRREIIINSVVNSLINRGGMTFAFRAIEETAASPEQITKAFVVAREVFDLRGFVTRVEALDNVVSTDTQTWMYLEFRRLMDRATRWFLQNRAATLDVQAEIDRFAEAARRLQPRIADLLKGSEHERLLEQARRLQDEGVPQDLAVSAAGVLDLYSVLDIVEIARSCDRDVDDVARLYFQLSEHFGVDTLLTRVSALPRDDRWDALARGSMRDDLYGALSALTVAVLRTAGDRTDPGEQIARWEELHADQLARAQTSLSGITRLERPGIAPLSVALRTLRSVIRSGSSD